MANRIPSFLLDPSPLISFTKETGKVKIPFIEKGIHHVAGAIKKGYVHWELSSQNGYLQKIDSRIKVLFLLFLIIVVSLKREWLPELYIFIFIFILAILSRLSLGMLYKRVLLLGFIFGFLIALPSAFNVITKGETLLSVAKPPRSYDFWIYHIPSTIGITREGIFGVGMLTLRVINSLSLSFLILYTTSFPEITRALKVLKVPDSFLIILALCYKYIFIFSKTIEEMHLAKKSRMVREVSNKKAREWIAGRLGFIFRKTQLRCEEVFKAMLGRGFSDNIKICMVNKLRARDWVTGATFFMVGISLLWM